MTQLVPTPSRMVLARAGLDHADAQLLRGLLQDAGIQVFLANETPAEGRAGLGYADLYVRATDKAKADAILGKVVTLPRAAAPVRLDPDGEEMACAHCASGRVHPFEGKVPTIVPGLKRQSRAGERWYHCLQCDSYFRDRRHRFAGWPIAVMWAVTLGFATLGLMWLINFLRFL